ncbi:MAG: precorrin-6Y C5,15-methyltransferase (decarboxylating) subunit CbiT [Propionibacteriaceae bacterium]
MIIDTDTAVLGRTPGLADGFYASDGLVTKRVIRAAALATLRPMPGQLLIDVGVGAGSVAIEWCRTDATCRAIGLERRVDRAERARSNAARLTLPGQMTIIDGDAAELFATIAERPDAVFFGGGASRELVDAVWEVLPVGGRLVVHGVTLETELLAIELYRERGGEVVRMLTETAAPLGKLTGLVPARAVIQWAHIKA